MLTPMQESISDQALEDAIHGTIAGLTGLDPDAVRPRFQMTPPNMPMQRTNWCAFGLQRTEYPGQSETASISETEIEVRQEEHLFFLLSFYGENASRNEARLRGGLQIDINRAPLWDAGIVVLSHGSAVKVPALLKTIWQPRVDATIVFSRFSSHVYTVGRIESARPTLDNEHYLTAIQVQSPT